MINNSPNMGKTQVFKELPLPSKAGLGDGLILIYKAVFICVKLLLDIRLNLVMISEGKKIQTKHKRDVRYAPFVKGGVNAKPSSSRPESPKGQGGNTVIKETDKIK